jgi:hypothetical protein
VSGHEQTPSEHDEQRALVQRSMLLADTRAERHGVYLKRKPVAPVVLNVGAHVFVLPRVVEVQRPEEKPL